MTEQELEVSLTVNGEAVRERIPARMLLGDFLRERCGITSNHFGCEHGVCGVCTILMDGESVRSCLLFAVQAEGTEITTVESLSAEGEELHPLQASFKKNHGLQCGFCTPGMLMTAVDLLENHDVSSEEAIRDGISGNICRCTGYQNIVKAIKAFSETEDLAYDAAGEKS